MIIDMLASFVVNILSWIIVTWLNAWPLGPIDLLYTLESTFIRLLSPEMVGVVLGLVPTATLLAALTAVFLVFTIALGTRLLIRVYELLTSIT